jgi:hypothetical protein
MLEQFLIDSKFTKAQSFTLTVKQLEKITREADLKDRVPAIVLEMGGEQWVVLPYYAWKCLL